MQFLKTLFWVLIAAVALLFSNANWVTVPVKLWAGVDVDAKLPALLLVAFLIGLLPALLLHRATRWSLRRKLSTMERALADVSSSAPEEKTSGALPPAAAPIAVPPGVS